VNIEKTPQPAEHQGFPLTLLDAKTKEEGNDECNDLWTQREAGQHFAHTAPGIVFDPQAGDCYMLQVFIA